VRKHKLGDLVQHARRRLQIREHRGLGQRLMAMRTEGKNRIMIYGRILRNALKGGVWRSVWCGLVGALLYTLIVIGLIVILVRSGINLIGLFERLTTP
jgi:hypothetical protein